MIRVYVFDIGGTLMEYQGMPYSWVEYYEPCFRYANKKLGIGFSEEEIGQAVEMLKGYNPRIYYHEEDYSPEFIFGEIIKKLGKNVELQSLITAFFEEMELTSVIYKDSRYVLRELRQRGMKIAALTDVAVGMPDSLHKEYFGELLPYFDIYVSSISCGYRKPNPTGLRYIAKKYNVSAEEIIFVGDEKKDIETAKRFGCKSILIDKTNSGVNYGQNFTITELKEILQIVGNYDFLL